MEKRKGKGKGNGEGERGKGMRKGKENGDIFYICLFYFVRSKKLIQLDAIELE
jgi:hypothetical protein